MLDSRRRQVAALLEQSFSHVSQYVYGKEKACDRCETIIRNIYLHLDVIAVPGQESHTWVLLMVMTLHMSLELYHVREKGYFLLKTDKTRKNTESWQIFLGGVKGDGGQKRSAQQPSLTLNDVRISTQNLTKPFCPRLPSSLSVPSVNSANLLLWGDCGG